MNSVGLFESISHKWAFARHTAGLVSASCCRLTIGFGRAKRVLTLVLFCLHWAQPCRLFLWKRR